MSELPIFFRKSAQTLISVGMTDFLTNRSYLILYGGKTADRTLLSSTTFYSNQTNLTTYPGGNTANDIDFDATVQVPLVLEGKGIVTVPLLHVIGNSGPGTVDTTLTVTLRKYDGSTETDIISENATATSNGNVVQNGLKGMVWSVDFTVPRTKFGVGDIIRITVATTAPGADKEIIVCHDPMDRDVPSTNSLGASTTTQPDTSKLTAWLPVIPDL